MRLHVLTHTIPSAAERRQAILSRPAPNRRSPSRTPRGLTFSLIIENLKLSPSERLRRARRRPAAPRSSTSNMLEGNKEKKLRLT